MIASEPSGIHFFRKSCATSALLSTNYSIVVSSGPSKASVFSSYSTPARTGRVSPITPSNRESRLLSRSTADQETEHQRQSIKGWLAYRDLSFGDVDIYAEQASSASSDRNQFQELIDAIEDGEYDQVDVWEISRIARKGFLAQRFFDACEDNDTTITSLAAVYDALIRMDKVGWLPT